MFNPASQGTNKFLNPEIRPNTFYQEVLPDGNAVRVHLNLPAKDLLASDFIIRQNGVAKTALSTAVVVRADFLPGAVWDVRLGSDWLLLGQPITIQYAGSAKIVNFSTGIISNNSVIRWQGVNCFNRKRSLSIHFNMATYGFQFGGNQQADPTLSNNYFNPTGLISKDSLNNWIEAAQAYGAETIMFTPQHSDGFMLWDSAYLPSHSLRAATTWWGANGFDIAREFCDKIRDAGMKVSIYNCVWNSRWELQNAALKISNYEAWKTAYTSYKVAVVSEIMTTFGELDEILFDGWAGINNYPTYSEVDKTSLLNVVKSNQANCVILMNDYSRQLLDCDLNVYEVGVGSEMNSSVTPDQFPSLVGGGPDFPKVYNPYPSRLWITPTLTGDSWFNNPAYQTYKSGSYFKALEIEANKRNCQVMFNLSPGTTGLFSASEIQYLSSLNPAND